jgi:hypothetical protein
MRALKGNISDVMAEAGQPAMEDLTQTIIDFNEWGTSGGYDQMAEGIGDVASAFAKVAEFGASTVQVLTDLYAVVSTQTLEVPEGMKMTDSQPFSDSFTIGVVPDVDLLDLTDSQLEQIKQTLEETATVQEEITGEYKKQTQELAKQNSEIPDWAGHSDYIRDQLAATGSRNIGELLGSGNTSVETFDTAVTSTRSIEQSAGGSISTSLLDVSRSGFNTLSQKLDTGFAGVIGAVNNISVGSGGSGSKSSSSGSVSAKDVATVKKVNGLHIIGLHSSNTRGF